MRIFEILTVLTLFLCTIGFFVPRNKRSGYIYLLPVLAGVFIFIHLMVENYRYQMIPIYAFAVILLLISVFHARKNVQGKETAVSKKSRILEIIMAFMGVIILPAATILPFLNPVVNLPKPSGPNSVGTTFFHLIDRSRMETLTEIPDDYREFTARVWYPAEPVKGSKVMPYRKHKPATGSLIKGPPDIIFSHFKLMKSNSHPDAPFVAGTDTYPVIGFSCGFQEDLDAYQLLFEELASNGYLVFSLNQPYESQSVVHPDGRIVPFKPSHAEEFFKSSKATLSLWKKFSATTDREERIAVTKEILRTEAFMDRIFRIRTADMQFTLDELNKMNSGEKESPFRGRLDMSRIGVFGHSGGGSVAGQCCAVDDRFTAGVNLDGFQFGDVINTRMQQPFMFMYSEMFSGTNDMVMENFDNTVYSLTVKGATHMDFSDTPYLLPIMKKMGKMSGKIPAKRMAGIINSYVLAFFDKYLKEKNTDLLEGPSPDYPEVIFNKNK
ncbi:MAG: hypothetical protein ABFR31_00100 [Thermodesulfobacteriota bacterium]